MKRTFKVIFILTFILAMQSQAFVVRRGVWLLSDTVTNAEKFILPAPETLSAASKRFEISVLPISGITLKNMQVWEKATTEFYKSNNVSSNYWYYKIQDNKNISEEELFQAKYVR